MTDPYYAGIDEPYHEWIRPRSVDCPNCACCTLALCEQARERGLLCMHLGGHAPGEINVADCPCTSRKADS